MPTLCLQLVGPMQSWGTTSRFDQRDTGKEPSKSGVIGLLAAAMGIDHENWADLEPLTHLKMGVRHDRPGIPRRDYHTAGCAATDVMVKADGALSKDGVVSMRYYLADAAFLVGLESPDRDLLNRIEAALRDPVWPLFLGRKSHVPSESIYLKNGILDLPLRDALVAWPWASKTRSGEKENTPKTLLISVESEDRSGAMKMDQPLSSFAERRFGARFVHSEWVSLPLEVNHVSEPT